MKDEAAKKQKPKIPSKYMTVQEVADFFRMSETSVRRGCAEFGQLRRVKLGKRTLFLRADVEALDRQLERQAKAPHDAVLKLSAFDLKRA